MQLVPLDQLAGELDKFNQLAAKSTTLASGQVINHPWYLDGGGGDYRGFFLQAVRNYGKEKYSRAFEWCCGHTVIGFEMLTQGICEYLSFNDIYKLAIDTSLENAKLLGFEDKVKGFLTPALSTIPKEDKWDLVVGNPPNSMRGEGFVKMGEDGDWSDAHITHALRIVLDEDFTAHKEFFQNIRDYTTEDADIFITLHSTMLKFSERELHGPNGYEIKNIIDMMPRDPDLKIVHFKSK